MEEPCIQLCIPLISTEDQYDSRWKHCQLGLNLTETGQNKVCQTFGILLGFYTQTMECPEGGSTTEG